jgi:hypothetical protein
MAHGRLVNLTATFPSADCGVYDIRGEMRRQQPVRE